MEELETLTLRHVKHGPFVCELVVPVTLSFERSEQEVVVRDRHSGLQGRGPHDQAALDGFASAFVSAVEHSDSRVRAYAATLRDSRYFIDHDLLTRARFTRQALDAFLGKHPLVKGWHQATVTITTGDDGARSVHVGVRVTLKAEASPDAEALDWATALHALEDQHDVGIRVEVVQSPVESPNNA